MDSYIKSIIHKLDEHSSIHIYLGKIKKTNVLNTEFSNTFIESFMSYLNNYPSSLQTNKTIYHNIYKYVLNKNNTIMSYMIEPHFSKQFNIHGMSCIVTYEKIIALIYLSNM